MNYKLYHISHQEFKHLLTNQDHIYLLKTLDQKALKDETVLQHSLTEAKTIQKFDIEQAIFNYKKKEVILKDHHNLPIANFKFESKRPMKIFSKFFVNFKTQKPSGWWYNNMAKLLVVLSIAFFWGGLTPTLGDAQSGTYNVRGVQGVRVFMEGLNAHVGQNIILFISILLFLIAMVLLLHSVDFFRRGTWKYLNVREG